MTVQDARTELHRRQGQRNQVEGSLENARLLLKEKRRGLRQHEQAREILRAAGLKTQQQLQYYISDITTLAMEAVFDDPYELVVEFVQRRNRTECDLLFVREGERVDPLTASGGGAVDVAAFALRIASWSMSSPRHRSTIILDEPMKNLSPEYREAGSRMIKEVSERLGVQFIIVNHEITLTSHADRVFRSSIRRGVTKIERTQ